MSKRRASHKTSAGSSGGGGLLRGMRTGMKRVAGQGTPAAPGKRRARAFDIALWVLVLGLLIYLLLSRLS